MSENPTEIDYTYRAKERSLRHKLSKAHVTGGHPLAWCSRCLDWVRPYSNSTGVPSKKTGQVLYVLKCPNAAREYRARRAAAAAAEGMPKRKPGRPRRVEDTGDPAAPASGTTAITAVQREAFRMYQTAEQYKHCYACGRKYIRNSLEHVAFPEKSLGYPDGDGSRLNVLTCTQCKEIMKLLAGDVELATRILEVLKDPALRDTTQWPADGSLPTFLFARDSVAAEITAAFGAQDPKPALSDPKDILK